MKKTILLTVILLLPAGFFAEAARAQENIRAMMKKCENLAVVEKDITRSKYPLIKTFNRTTTVITVMYDPLLEKELEEAFRRDSEHALQTEEQIRDSRVSSIRCRFESSTYSYSISNSSISIIESLEANRPLGVYSFFINVVQDGFRWPLIGFLNTAVGSHQNLQLGFVNTTLVDFSSAQLGFVNSTFNDFTGLQAGYVNTTLNELAGLQAGFVNSAGFITQKGSQIGFVNLMRKEVKGAQIGYVNMAGGNVQGTQIGFMNATRKEIKGVQAGFVNLTGGKVQGSQIGFLNLTGGKILGSQIGFLNYADTVTGVPIGFLTIVKKGGYRAVEFSANEWYPVNLSFKIGVPLLYTFFHGSYNANFEKQYALGYGMGSLLPLSKKFYFNPEIGSMHPVSKEYQTQIQSFAGNFLYKLSPHLQLAAGPSVAHVFSDNDEYTYKPVFHILDHRIDSKNRLVIGFRAAISVNF